MDKQSKTQKIRAVANLKSRGGSVGKDVDTHQAGGRRGVGGL